MRSRLIRPDGRLRSRGGGLISPAGGFLRKTYGGITYPADGAGLATMMGFANAPVSTRRLGHLRAGLRYETAVLLRRPLRVVN